MSAKIIENPEKGTELHDDDVTTDEEDATTDEEEEPLEEINRRKGTEPLEEINRRKGTEPLEEINRRKGTEPLEEINRRKGTEPLEEINRRKGTEPLLEDRRKGTEPLLEDRRKGTEPLLDLIESLSNLDINDNPDINDNNIYELAIITSRLINNKIDELGKIEWTNGESNLDSGYSKLACNCCEEAWNEYILKYKEFRRIRIKCTIPDINIIFEYPDKKKTIEKKIELKSSKNSKMPGSTIRKLDVNQPLIYCLRSENPLKFETRCSLYHQAMGESDLELFQDRSPRPCINFEKNE